MEFRRLGDSDLEVTAICMGTWAIGGWMWGGADADDAVAAIRKGVEQGVTSIDTAPAYGFGRSEELVARAIEPFRRDELQILTKYGLRWDAAEGEFFFDSEDNAGRPLKIYRNARRDSVMYECEQSLRRLKVDRIDLYQCHWRDHTTPVDETMEAMARLIEQGKIRAVGVSNFTVEEIDACRKVVPLASDQPPYSMVNRGIEADVLPYCREHNVGVLAYSPMQRGLLTGKITPGYKFNAGDHRAADPFFQPDVVAKVNAFLDRIRPIAEAHNATLAQIAIAWTIRRPGVTAALVGARDPRQALENAAAADVDLTDDQIARINALLDKLDLPIQSG